MPFFTPWSIRTFAYFCRLFDSRVILEIRWKFQQYHTKKAYPYTYLLQWHNGHMWADIFLVWTFNTCKKVCPLVPSTSGSRNKNTCGCQAVGWTGCFRIGTGVQNTKACPHSLMTDNFWILCFRCGIVILRDCQWSLNLIGLPHSVVQVWPTHLVFRVYLQASFVKLLIQMTAKWVTKWLV